MSTLFLTSAWILPNHYPPWVNFHSEFLTFLGLGALVFALLKKSSSGFAIPSIAIGAFALAAIPWTHYAVGVVFFAGDAFISSIYSICLAIAVAVGYKHSQITGAINDGVWRLPAQVLLSAAGVSSLLAFLQWLSLTGPFNTFMATTDVGDRAKSFGNKNNHEAHCVKFLLGEAANDSSCTYRAKARLSTALVN